jgi:hypothetical protein
VARVGDRWILWLGRPPPYVPEVGKRCSGHADRLSYQTTAAFNYGDLCCWMHSIWPATSSLSRSLFPNAWLGLTPPAWTPRCRSSPGTHRERVSRPAPSRRTDTGQDRPHCLVTQHSRGPTCPRRTALAVSLSTTDLDQLRWTAEAPTPVGLQALPLRRLPWAGSGVWSVLMAGR